MKQVTVTMTDGKEYKMAFTLAARMNIKKEFGKNVEEVLSGDGVPDDADMFKIIFIILNSQIEPFPYDFEQFTKLADFNILQGFTDMISGDKGNQ